MINNRNNNKLNFMKIRNNVLTWRQIETRDGRLFMRVAVRPVLSIKRYQNAVGL